MSDNEQPLQRSDIEQLLNFSVQHSITSMQAPIRRRLEQQLQEWLAAGISLEYIRARLHVVWTMAYTDNAVIMTARFEFKEGAVLSGIDG